jgi:hypothetical protein
VPVWAWSVTSGRTRRGVCLVPQAARGTLLQSPIFPGADGQKAQIPSSIIITIAHRQSRCTSIHHPASPDSTSALIPHSLIAYLSCILVVSCLVWSAARAVPGRIRGVSSCSSSDCSYIGGFLQHPLLTLLLAYIYTYIYTHARTHSRVVDFWAKAAIAINPYAPPPSSSRASSSASHFPRGAVARLFTTECKAP